MVTARTQKRQVKANAKAKVAAKATVDKAVDQAVKRVRKSKPIACTVEEIVEERDRKGLSWRQVAINLNLGSPGAARKAYAELTGKPHNTSIMHGRRATRGSRILGVGKVDSPNWNDDSDQDEIISKLTECVPKPEDRRNCIPGKHIRVVRQVLGATLDEEFTVHKLIKFTFDGKEEDGPLVLQLVDCENRGFRTVRVADIVEVR